MLLFRIRSLYLEQQFSSVACEPCSFLVSISNVGVCELIFFLNGCVESVLCAVDRHMFDSLLLFFLLMLSLRRYSHKHWSMCFPVEEEKKCIVSSKFKD